MVSLLLSFSISTFAENLAEKPERIFDEGNLFTDYQKEQFQNSVDNFKEKETKDIVVLTTQDTCEEDLKTFATNFYQDGNFGEGETHDGVIIAYSSLNQEKIVIPFGDLTEIISEERAKEIADSISDIKTNYTIPLTISRIGDTIKQGPPEPWVGNTVVGKGDLASKPQRVFDKAELFSPEESTTIEKEIKALREKLNIDIVVQTTNTTQGMETKMYAADFYDYGGFGTGDTHDGIIFIIDMEHRNFYLVTTGNMIATFSDRRIENIISVLTPLMRDEDYVGTVELLFTNVEKYVTDGPPKGWVYNKETGQSERYKYMSPLKVGVALFFGLLAAGVFALIISRKYQLKGKVYSYSYYDNSDVDLQVKEDNKISDFVTTRTIRTNNNSSGGFGGGGGSSTFSGSSGTSHGGGGGSF